jgi:hypothetical protein
MGWGVFGCGGVGVGGFAGFVLFGFWNKKKRMEKKYEVRRGVDLGLSPPGPEKKNKTKKKKKTSGPRRRVCWFGAIFVFSGGSHGLTAAAGEKAAPAPRPPHRTAPASGKARPPWK